MISICLLLNSAWESESALHSYKRRGIHATPRSVMYVHRDKHRTADSEGRTRADKERELCQSLAVSSDIGYSYCKARTPLPL